ncbi:MAG: diguanylate cyclase [bacterium]
MKNKLWFSIFTGYLLLLALLTLACGYLLERGLERQVQALMTSEILKLSARFEQIKDLKTGSLSAASDLINDYQLGNSGFAWLIDNKGRFLAYSQRQRVLKPQVIRDDQKESIPFILQKKDMHGKIFSAKISNRFVVFTKIPGTDWIVALTCLKEDVSRIAYKGLKEMALAFYLLSFLGLVISYFIAKGHVRPIRRFYEFMSSLSSGNLDVEPPPSEKMDGDMKDWQLISQRIKDKLKDSEIPDSSPLTGLPSNKSLQNVLFKIIDSKNPLALAFLDINHFGSYNRKYGFEKGDSVIRLTAALIANKAGEFGNSEDFVAHLGADHFAIVTTPDKVEGICREIISAFDEQIRHHYSAEDLKHGYILSKDRKGNIDKFHIMTLSIGVATNNQKQMIHPLQIIQTTAEIRDYLRGREESSYLVDRRAEERENTQDENPPKSDRKEPV